MMGKNSSKAANSSDSEPAANNSRPMTRAWRRLTGQPLEGDPRPQWNNEEKSSRKRLSDDDDDSDVSDGDGPSRPKEGRYAETDEESEDDQSLTNAGSLKESPFTTRSILDQQNKAYNESLLADQEKERVKLEKMKEEEAKKARDKQINRQKAKAKENLPPESGSDEEGIFPLRLRLPSGTLIRRNFRSTDLVNTLRQFVFSHDETPVDFELVMYPKTVLPNGSTEDGSNLTLGDVGITRKEVLRVRAKMEC